MSESIEKETDKKKDKNLKKQIIGNYRIEKTIGEGTFGKVKLGIHIPTEEKVAIKILEKDKIQDREDLERISREINFLKKLNHPNIIKIYDIIENSKNFYIIMELANNGELFKYIVKKKKLDEAEASFFYYQLILGLEAIHKQKIVHRDIKPENLLLKENNILTIIDFGLSNQYKKNQYLKTSCGSPCYAAPEMILGRKYNGLLVDLWSSGIVLYAMVCGYLPFEDKNNDKLYKKILNGKFDLPSRLSNECKDLIKKILTVNPKNRIGIEGVKSHPFLTRASLNYHIDDVLLRNEKGKYCDIIIEKMVNMKTCNFKKEDIIFNLDNNKHNNITATYELLLKKYKLDVNMRSGLSGLYSMTSASSFGGGNNVIKTSGMKINVKKEEKNEKEKYDKTDKNKKSSNDSRNNSNSKISKSYRSKNSSINNRKRYRNTFNGSSVNRTIDSNNSNQSSKNDFSSSLDISKVVKKNKIDSNIIIGIPKLVPVNKKIFTTVKNKYNNNKSNSPIKEYYDKDKKKKKNYSRSKSKNSDINTSVSYERSAKKCKLNTKNKSKSKEIMYIPSNTINLMEIMNSKNTLNKESNVSSESSFYNNDKKVNHYSSFNINDDNDAIEFYPRSHSNYIKLNKKNNTYLIKNTSFNQNAESKYLLTFNEDSNLYLNKTVSNRSKISNYSISSTNSQMSYNNLQNKGKNSRAIKVESSFPKTQIHQKNNNQIYFHKKNCKSNINSNLNNYNSNNLSKKIQSPTHKNNSTSNYYCTSFTETNSISNISTSKKKNQINPSNIKKANNEISITIKKENSIIENNPNKNIKTNTVIGKKTINSIRPVSPVNLITQFSESNTKNKTKQNYKINSIRQKPATVDIDITINTKEQKDNTNNNSHHQIKSRKGNNSKNKKMSINSQRKNSGTNLNKKSFHSKAHDVNVIKLVSDNSKSNVTKAKKTSNNNNKNKNPKNQPVEINFDLENDIDMKNKMISNKRDFALCTTNSSLEEINDKLTLLCIDNGLTLTKIDNLKYICKKNSDNSINIEVSTVGKNNVLKLYHLNGQENITKEIIKKIIISLAF